MSGHQVVKELQALGGRFEIKAGLERRLVALEGFRHQFATTQETMKPHQPAVEGFVQFIKIKGPLVEIDGLRQTKEFIYGP